MRRLAWMTDIHLNFLTDPELQRLLQRVAAHPGDALLLTGDIAEAPSLERYLFELADAARRPLYFVLGNHDFYGSSIVEVRARMTALCARSPWLRWLPSSGVVALTAETALLGVDGWGDGLLGSGMRSPVELNDFGYITELTGLSRAERFARLAALGERERDRLRELLPRALDSHRRIVLLTHVPPFREACWHQGRVSADDWLPYFTCAAVGEYLRETMTAHPEHELLVLCGHTHGGGEAAILPNLRVLTGGADYGAPELQADVLVR